MKSCSICGGLILMEPSGWAGGHNARPVTNGRCCAKCNEGVVIPARIKEVREHERLGESNE
jgi:hypothetical protein